LIEAAVCTSESDVLCRSGQNVKAPQLRATTLTARVKHRLRWALAGQVHALFLIETSGTEWRIISSGFKAYARWKHPSRMTIALIQAASDSFIDGRFGDETGLMLYGRAQGVTDA
jgi:hypothetical protein